MAVLRLGVGLVGLAGLGALVAGLAGCDHSRSSSSAAEPLQGGRIMAQAPVVHRPWRGGKAQGSLLLAHAAPLSATVGTLGHAPDGTRETALVDLLPEGDRPLPGEGLCPPDMASIDDRYCVDKYEGSLVEILGSGDERPWPHYLPVEGKTVRAVSDARVLPQGYISGVQAREACGRSGKRLCKASEWKKACTGPANKKWGYSDAKEAKRCNDYGTSPVGKVFGATSDLHQQAQWDWAKMNHPVLDQLERTVAPTGSHEGCTNDYGVYDMVGNIHEWVDDPDGTFLGGYFQDTEKLGDGCGYKADAHAFSYHDYSTGFRCCADVAQ